MATSGTRDGAYTANSIVSAALRKLFVVEGSGVPSSEDADIGLEALKLMLRTWGATHMPLWLYEDQEVTLIADTASYALSPRATEISDSFLRDSNNNDTPCRIMDREEYNRLPDKTSSGEPFAVWMDRQRTASTLYVYPVPSAAGSSVFVTIKRAIEDVTDLSEDVEFPAEWMECIVYNLAVRLAPEFGADISPLMISMAQNLEQDMRAQGREDSIRFVVGYG